MMAKLAMKYVKQVNQVATGKIYSDKRKAAKVSQGEMAIRLGMSQQILCDKEKGRRPWTESFADRYLAALNH